MFLRHCPDRVVHQRHPSVDRRGHEVLQWVSAVGHDDRRRQPPQGRTEFHHQARPESTCGAFAAGVADGMLDVHVVGPVEQAEQLVSADAGLVQLIRNRPGLDLRPRGPPPSGWHAAPRARVLAVRPPSAVTLRSSATLYEPRIESRIEHSSSSSSMSERGNAPRQVPVGSRVVGQPVSVRTCAGGHGRPRECPDRQGDRRGRRRDPILIERVLGCERSPSGCDRGTSDLPRDFENTWRHRHDWRDRRCDAKVVSNRPILRHGRRVTGGRPHPSDAIRRVRSRFCRRGRRTPFHPYLILTSQSKLG